MKKTWLLTSLATLALVLSLGACNEAEGDETLESGEETTSSESSGGTLTEGGSGGNTSSDTSGNTSTTLTAATNPGELVELANQTGNYSMEIVLVEWESDEVSVEDYNNKNYDFTTLVEGMTGYEWVIDAYFTEDALLIDYSMVYGDDLYFLWEELWVNVPYGAPYNNIVQYYYTYDLTNWTYYGAYYYTWETYFGSFFDNSSIGISSSDFVLYQSGYDTNYDYVEVYDYKNSNSLTSFGKMAGTDLWTTTWTYYGWLEEMNYIYFYPEYQDMFAYLYAYAWFYTDDNYTALQIVEDDFYIYYYSVGITDISSVVNSVTSSYY